MLDREEREREERGGERQTDRQTDREREGGLSGERDSLKRA
jgi:hypothetical protein